MLNKVKPIRYIFIVLSLLIASCSLVEDTPPTGFYTCKGPYKSMEFNEGSVIVTMAGMQKAGTYTTEGTKLNLILDGKSLVFDSPGEPSINVAPEDFQVLASRYVQCFTLRVAVDALKMEMSTPEGKAFFSTGAAKANVDEMKKLAKEHGVDW